MEVGDHLNKVRFNICGHLGRQTGETARTGHFQARSVCYSLRF